MIVSTSVFYRLCNGETREGERGNILQVWRSWRVVAKLHGELSLALRGGAELGAEAEHGVEGAVAGEGEVLGADVGVVDGGVALVHEHEDAALELVGGGDGGLHEGLEDLAAGLLEGLAEGHLRGEVEGVVGRVGNVGGAVVDDHLGADDVVAQEGALVGRGLEALGAGSEELVGDVAADDLALVEVLAGLLVGLDPTRDAGEVAGAAALALEQEVEVGAVGDGLAVGDAGLAGDAVGLVLTAETLDVDLQVQFAHAGDDGLLALGVDVDSEGGILTGEAVHGLTEVVCIPGALGLDGERHDGIWNEHGRHGVGETTVGEGVSGSTVDTEHGTDLTSTDVGDILHLVGVHADNAGDSDLLARAGVEESSLVDSDVGKLAVVVLLKLKGETNERQGVVRHKLDRLLVLGSIQGQVVGISRVGQVFTHGIEHGLDGLVGQGGSHHDRSELAGNGGPSDGSLDLFVGGFDFLKEQFGNLIIDISELLNQSLALLVGEFLEDGRDLVGHADFDTTGAFKVHGLHFDQINDTLVLILETNGDLDSSGRDLEFLVDLLDGLPGVGAHSVHLVDKGDTGDIVALHLSVDGDGLGLDAADSTENHDGTIENAESALNLDGEVDMAGSVDKIDMIHGVHLGANGIFSSNFVNRLDSAGVEQNSLSNRSLATVDVCLETLCISAGLRRCAILEKERRRLTAIPMLRTLESLAFSAGFMLAATYSGVRLEASVWAFFNLKATNSSIKVQHGGVEAGIEARTLLEQRWQRAKSG
ncbi:unnamed protein product [Clonostachys solani]|uniref:Uncharacterized protein n=1 Tax=Clonostachys solani TaxID=160281 RepID=A0A9N9ZHX0_9HYPO|nr:unnamed protein product [Clonostachys solani]